MRLVRIAAQLGLGLLIDLPDLVEEEDHLDHHVHNRYEEGSAGRDAGPLEIDQIVTEFCILVRHGGI